MADAIDMFAQSPKRFRTAAGFIPCFPAGMKIPVNGRSVSLYIESDERNLSQYQCLARQQIELFESTVEEAGTNAQGRNRPIVPGQVGIRCKHCAKLPPKQRKTGSVYYPNKVSPGLVPVAWSFRILLYD